MSGKAKKKRIRRRRSAKRATRVVVTRLFCLLSDARTLHSGVLIPRSDFGVNENAVNSGFPHSLPFVQDEVQTERVVHVE